jgi:hypothetical protein
MTWPADWMTVVGRGHLLPAEADREHVIDILKAAFVQGRVTIDELELRVAQTFSARTYANLAAVTADLPAQWMSARSASQPSQVQAGQDFRAAIRMVIMATILAVAVWLGTCFPVDAAFSG